MNKDPPSPALSLASAPEIMSCGADAHDLGPPSPGPLSRPATPGAMTPPTADLQTLVPPVCADSDADFSAAVEQVRLAIADGLQPMRIRHGSSGSYFCRDRSGTIVGVFKPKNEEPYGHMNPKWNKWLHKHLFPCCFGRSCLIPNMGYASEAAASTLDRLLGLHVVPRTQMVSLASPAFHYSARERRQFERQRRPLTPKLGSFQLFLRGFRDSSVFFLAAALPAASPCSNHGWTRERQHAFRMGFERLVALDYLMRNTDRTSDNWMVRENPEDAPVPVQLAAIDNGLAFPYKHPDRWRSYPYSWASLPAARVPFSRETRQLLLPQLTSEHWWTEAFAALERVFRADADFDSALWERQRAVMRGQGYNLVHVLEKGEWLDTQLALRLATMAPTAATCDDPHIPQLAARLAECASPAALIQLQPLAVFDEPDDGQPSVADSVSDLAPATDPVPPPLRRPGQRLSYRVCELGRFRRNDRIVFAPRRRRLLLLFRRHRTPSDRSPPLFHLARRPWFSWC